MPTLPPIVGLSHVYGETEDLEAQSAFWTAHSFRCSFAVTLEVPDEKRAHLLDNRCATEIDLRYFEPMDPYHSPGLEFLRHKPAGSTQIRSDIPPMWLALAGSSSDPIVDPDENLLVFRHSIPTRTLVRIGVPSLAEAGEVVRSLGFYSRGNPVDLDRVVFGAADDGSVAELFEFALPLFPMMSVQLILREDDHVPFRRPIDARGWQGLSFVTPNLGEVARRLPLVAGQRIKRQDNRSSDIAFFSGAGLLFEFLHVCRERVEAR